MMYICICAFKHLFSHELVLNSNSNSTCAQKKCGKQGGGEKYFFDATRYKKLHC